MQYLALRDWLKIEECSFLKVMIERERDEELSSFILQGLCLIRL
jgi:hypothetical protein